MGTVSVTIDQPRARSGFGILPSEILTHTALYFDDRELALFSRISKLVNICLAEMFQSRYYAEAHINSLVAYLYDSREKKPWLISSDIEALAHLLESHFPDFPHIETTDIPIAFQNYIKRLSDQDCIARFRSIYNRLKETLVFSQFENRACLGSGELQRRYSQGFAFLKLRTPIPSDYPYYLETFTIGWGAICLNLARTFPPSILQGTIAQFVQELEGISPENPFIQDRHLQTMHMLLLEDGKFWKDLRRLGARYYRHIHEQLSQSDFQGIESLEVAGLVSQDLMGYLHKMPNLKTLTLRHVTIVPEAIGKIPNLQRLILTGNYALERRGIPRSILENRRIEVVADFPLAAYDYPPPLHPSKRTWRELMLDIKRYAGIIFHGAMMFQSLSIILAPSFLLGFCAAQMAPFLLAYTLGRLIIAVTGTVMGVVLWGYLEERGLIDHDTPYRMFLNYTLQ